MVGATATRSRFGGWPCVSLVAAYTMLAGAWFMGNPLTAAPDEPEHYIKTIGLARGDWFGGAPTNLVLNTVNQAGIETTAKLTRAFYMPADFAVPARWFCMIGDHVASAACVFTPTGPEPRAGPQPSYVARYQPYPYILPAVASRLAPGRDAALGAARLAIALSSVPFLVAAVIGLWGGRVLSEIGLLVAVTPMVIFTTIVLSPSGPEIAGAVCVLACIVRLGRDQSLPRSFWATMALACVAMVGSRALGVLWLAVDVALLTWLVGVPRLRQVGRAHRGGVILTIAASVIAAAASVAWQVAVPAVGGGSLAPGVGSLLQGVIAVPEVFAESIGIFGWQNTEIPRYGYAIWGAMTVALVLGAMRRGNNRERKLVDAVLVTVGSLTVLIGALVLIPIGYAMQGRYILPVGVAVPLIAAEVLWRRRHRMGPAAERRLVLAVFSAGAFVQFIAWYANAHRAAVGTEGNWIFLVNTRWTPAFGWLPWVALALLGSLGLAVAPMLSTARSHGH